MAGSRWQDIYMHLKSKGVEVYSPAQHTGECKTEYVVLKDAGGTKFGSYSTTMSVYDVMCYVPQSQFSQLEVYKETVKAYMKELEKAMMIRPTHFETPSFYDEETKGHMVSIQYELYKQIT